MNDNRAIHGKLFGSDEDPWLFLCGNAVTIDKIFKLIREQAEKSSLLNITVDYIHKNLDKFEGRISTLPYKLCQKIKDKARYDIKELDE